MQVWNITEEVESLGPCPKSCNSYPYRLQLEQDVSFLYPTFTYKSFWTAVDIA